MKIKLKKPRWRHPILVVCLLIVVGAFAGIMVAGFTAFGYYYVKYANLVSERFREPVFADTAKIYAAPEEIRPGQAMPIALIAQELRKAGYVRAGEDPLSQMGTFIEGPNSITVRPGPKSYFAPDGATIQDTNGVVNSITNLQGQPLASYNLEPVLITGLSESEQRIKRRLVTYNELPPDLVDAVLAIEDRTYFQHGAVDYKRIVASAIHDYILPGHHMLEGASTITMQLAKLFFLTPERTFKRKFLQVVLTFQLEHRFTKKQIFQMYANEVPLGHHGTFNIDGFGEASQVYFGKNVQKLTLDEAALLAGLIQSPNYLSPFRHPHRAIVRRDMVLDAMAETGAITKAEAAKAKAQPLHLSQVSMDASEAPYFVDLVRNRLVHKLGDVDFNREGLRIYTSLDPDLQRIATEAVQSTMPLIDRYWLLKNPRERRLHNKADYPQVALVALDPHTGQVLALVGGRNYSESQFDHALSVRPTGSTFKPFVYAMAFNTALHGVLLPGEKKLFSQLTILDDEPTTYVNDNQIYTPHNFEGVYHETVTARQALTDSLNNATIDLASKVGFVNVAALARQAGIVNAKGTPSVAIGAYGTTPLALAGAYTTFANSGLFIHPWVVSSVRTPNGAVIANYSPETKQLLDPRVAFLTVNMMESVINHGTGARARAMGFTAPAAGKTGTENDSWFAGFTTNLLCVVWVGNNTYTNLNVQGANAALPIWTKFMMNAVKLPQYSDVHQFAPPPGVEIVSIDKSTNLLSDAACSDDVEQVAFLDGTAPTATCNHPNGHRNLLERIFGFGRAR